MKLQVKANHYLDKLYETKERFISYWHQIDEIIAFNPQNVLEIGIGNSFLSRYLKERGVCVTTLDIDIKLMPDVVGNILNLPFPDKSFDVITCYEVLEHLPYENFHRALSEIFRISKLHAVLSLPDVDRIYPLYNYIPKIGIFKKLIPIPQFKKTVHKFDGQHYWEIGKAKYPLNRIVSDIEKAGFKVKRTHRIFEHPYHRFFILKKISINNYDKNRE